MRQIRHVPRLEWCRHRDDERVRRLRFCRCPEQTSGHRPFDQNVEIGFNDVDVSGIDGGDGVGVDVDAQHLNAAAREDGGRR